MEKFSARESNIFFDEIYFILSESMIPLGITHVSWTTTDFEKTDDEMTMKSVVISFTFISYITINNTPGRHQLPKYVRKKERNARLKSPELSL